MTVFRNFCLLAVLCIPIPAAASLVTYEFEGEITSLIGNGLGLFGSGKSVGDAFSGRFSYETGLSNPDQAPSDPNQGGYNLTSFEVDGGELSILSGIIAVVNPLPVPVLPPATSTPDSFRIVLTVDNNPYASSPDLILSAPAGFFTDDSLPELLDLADYSEGASLGGVLTIGINGTSGQEDRGQLRSLTLVPSSPIPLPPGLPLLGAGLLAIGALKVRG